MPAVRDRKHLCPPGEEEFRSKVLSCEAPLLGPAPLIPFYIVKPVACFFFYFHVTFAVIVVARAPQ